MVHGAWCKARDSRRAPVVTRPKVGDPAESTGRRVCAVMLRRPGERSFSRFVTIETAQGEGVPVAYSALAEAISSKYSAKSSGGSGPRCCRAMRRSGVIQTYVGVPTVRYMKVTSRSRSRSTRMV